MRKEQQKKINLRETGITLVALVVTIVVMLILASITIGSITGDNGIITNARFSKFATEIRQVQEKVQLKQLINENEYSGTINELLNDNNKYNNKLLVEDNILKYIASAVTSEEEQWLIKLGIEKASDYYIVEFDSAGGTEISSQTVRTGKTAQKPSNPTKTGYEFLGWYYLEERGTEENPTYEEKEFNFTTTILSNYSLYAKYQGEAVIRGQNNNIAFWQEKYRTNITEILFTAEANEVPTIENTIDSWNIRADNKCSDVMAYIKDDNTGNDTYKLIIYSPNTIYAYTSMTDYFRDFTELKTINFENFDTSKARTMRTMFKNCNKLQSLNLENFNTKNITNMNNAFANCTSLTNVNVSSFKTNKVENMYGMFQYCSSLNTLNLNNFDTSNVKTMQVMFRSCSNLESINLISFDTSKVNNLKQMFKECKAISTIDLSSFDTNNVTNMDGMFYNCPELVTIYVGENFSTEKVENTEYVFRYTNKLVGGKGTKFSASHNDIEYARIDEGEDKPGYFTLKK